jgi:hypothetical protein
MSQREIQQERYVTTGSPGRRQVTGAVLPHSDATLVPHTEKQVQDRAWDVYPIGL